MMKARIRDVLEVVVCAGKCGSIQSQDDEEYNELFKNIEIDNDEDM